MILIDAAPQKEIAQPKIKVTASDIDRALHIAYMGNSQIKVSNVYVYNWESDLFLLKQNHNVYEFEIKVSKQDYKADFGKIEKHEVLQYGYYTHKNKSFSSYGKQTTLSRPNKFFYVCPTGLIDKSELPVYAGLLYYDAEKRTIIKIKEAPFLHRDKFTNFYSLSRSLNNRIIDQRSENIVWANNAIIARDILDDIINNTDLCDEARAYAKRRLEHLPYYL